jgi:hypothetical protein
VYNYSGNNPICRIDPSGLLETSNIFGNGLYGSNFRDDGSDESFWCNGANSEDDPDQVANLNARWHALHGGGGALGRKYGCGTPGGGSPSTPAVSTNTISNIMFDATQPNFRNFWDIDFNQLIIPQEPFMISDATNTSSEGDNYGSNSISINFISNFNDVFGTTYTVTEITGITNMGEGAGNMISGLGAGISVGTCLIDPSKANTARAIVGVGIFLFGLSDPAGAALIGIGNMMYGNIYYNSLEPSIDPTERSINRLIQQLNGKPLIAPKRKR